MLRRPVRSTPARAQLAPPMQRRTWMAATATAQSLDRASASWNSRTTLSALMDVGECSGTLTAARARGRGGAGGQPAQLLWRCGLRGSSESPYTLLQARWPQSMLAFGRGARRGLRQLEVRCLHGRHGNRVCGPCTTCSSYLLRQTQQGRVQAASRPAGRGQHGCRLHLHHLGG